MGSECPNRHRGRHPSKKKHLFLSPHDLSEAVGRACVLVAGDWGYGRIVLTGSAPATLKKAMPHAKRLGMSENQVAAFFIENATAFIYSFDYWSFPKQFLSAYRGDYRTGVVQGVKLADEDTGTAYLLGAKIPQVTIEREADYAALMTDFYQTQGEVVADALFSEPEPLAAIKEMARLGEESLKKEKLATLGREGITHKVAKPVGRGREFLQRLYDWVTRTNDPARNEYEFAVSAKNEQNYRDELRRVEEVTGIEVSFIDEDAQLIDFFNREFAFPSFKTVSEGQQRVVRDVFDRVMNGDLRGEGVNAIRRELGNQLNPLKNPKMRHNIERIVRTEVARMTAQAHKKADVEMGFKFSKWSTTGDERVCPFCQHEEAQGAQPILEGRYPPRHPNCRCDRFAVGSTLLPT